MAKHVDQLKLRVEEEEIDGTRAVSITGDTGAVIDLAVHYEPTRKRHRVLTLRAARRSLMDAVKAIDRRIAKATREDR